MGKLKEELLKLRQNLDAIYAAGKASAGDENYYDTFWNTFQDDGNRSLYAYAFASGHYTPKGWNDTNFKPKYNMQPTSADYMFYYANVSDINECLERAGVTIDFSKCTTFGDMLNNCATTTFPPIDLSSANSLTNIFRYAKQIKKIELRNVKSTLEWGVNAFAVCSELAELYIVSGTIGTSLYLGVCSKLTTESVQSIINALADLTGGTSKTLTLHATVKNKLTDEQKAQITSKNWTLA